MKQSLGKLERKLFAYAQLRGSTTIRTGELRESFGISVVQERLLLSRLAAAGMICRVRRGLYLVPAKLPLGGSWTPSVGMALNALIDDRNGRYQVSGPNAFSRYGFTEQIPARTYVYNNRLYGEKRIGSVELTLIKVADSRLGLTEQAVSPDGTAILYASRVRTLVDAVYDWSRFGSLPQAYEWIRADLRKERITAEELIEACIAFGDIGARRRIGYLLERLQVGEKQLRRVEKTLRSTSAFIPWIPTKPKRGPLVRRWGVVDNGPQ